MARLPRLALANHVHHVVQRGNNRQPIFHGPDDYERMHGLLVEHARRLGVGVHAYVLMPSHLHLLATPCSDDGLAQLMQSVGRSYVRWFNVRYGRSGTLWEGRFRSTLVEADRHLLTGMAHIELGPQRADLVERASAWVWSSNACNLGQRPDALVKPHARFWALGNTPFAREAAYAELLRLEWDLAEPEALAKAVLHGWPLGSAEFVASLGTQFDRRVVKRKAGRPLKI